MISLITCKMKSQGNVNVTLWH